MDLEKMYEELVVQPTLQEHAEKWKEEACTTLSINSGVISLIISALRFLYGIEAIHGGESFNFLGVFLQAILSVSLVCLGVFVISDPTEVVSTTTTRWKKRLINAAWMLLIPLWPTYHYCRKRKQRILSKFSVICPEHILSLVERLEAKPKRIYEETTEYLDTAMNEATTWQKKLLLNKIQYNSGDPLIQYRLHQIRDCNAQLQQEIDSLQKQRKQCEATYRPVRDLCEQLREDYKVAQQVQTVRQIYQAIKRAEEAQVIVGTKLFELSQACANTSQSLLLIGEETQAAAAVCHSEIEHQTELSHYVTQ